MSLAINSDSSNAQPQPPSQFFVDAAAESAFPPSPSEVPIPSNYPDDDVAEDHQVDEGDDDGKTISPRRLVFDSVARGKPAQQLITNSFTSAAATSAQPFREPRLQSAASLAVSIQEGFVEGEQELLTSISSSMGLTSVMDNCTLEDARSASTCNTVCNVVRAMSIALTNSSSNNVFAQEASSEQLTVARKAYLSLVSMLSRLFDPNSTSYVARSIVRVIAEEVKNSSLQAAPEGEAAANLDADISIETLREVERVIRLYALNKRASLHLGAENTASPLLKRTMSDSGPLSYTHSAIDGDNQERAAKRQQLMQKLEDVTAPTSDTSSAAAAAATLRADGEVEFMAAQPDPEPDFSFLYNAETSSHDVTMKSVHSYRYKNESVEMPHDQNFLIVGRMKSVCDVVMTSENVSRIHLIVFFVDALRKVVVLDLASYNGTHIITKAHGRGKGSTCMSDPLRGGVFVRDFDECRKLYLVLGAGRQTDWMNGGDISKLMATRFVRERTVSIKPVANL